MKILIIEDEIRAAKELERILLSLDEEITIVAIIDTVEAGIDFLSKNQPDLIFSDIQLADGICFDIYRNVSIKSPIVFCTSFDEYMMEAFDTNAVHYILKPISTAKVETALDKFHKLKQAFEPQAAYEAIERVSLQLTSSYKSTFLVETRGKIIPLPTNDICFCFLNNTTVNMVSTKNQKFVISSSLDEIENSLNPSIFYRANRQFLINKNYISDIERYFSRKLIVKLTYDTPETIIISKAKASGFLKWLEGKDT